MKRIAIVGGIAAGKTTLALRLGEITGLPVYHSDRMECRETNADGKMRTKFLVEDLPVDADWIVDGAYKNLPHWLQHADLVIYLDTPLLWRTWRHLCRWCRGNAIAHPETMDFRRNLRCLLNIRANGNDVRLRLGKAFRSMGQPYHLARICHKREIESLVARLWPTAAITPAV